MGSIVAEVFGWVGAILVLGAYFLVSTGKAEGSSNSFQYMNIAGAVCLIIYTYHCEAYASFAVNSVWVLIGLRSMHSISKSKKTIELPVEMAGPAPLEVVPIVIETGLDDRLKPGI